MADVIIGEMKLISRKYIFFFLVLIIVEAIVISAVLIDALADVSTSPVITPVFNFLTEWVIVISVIVVCLGILLFFISTRQSYRSRFVNKLHDWASDAVIILSRYRQEKVENDAQSGNFQSLLEIIGSLTLDYRGIFMDSFLDQEIRSRKKEVVGALNSIRKKALRKDKSAFNELPQLQHGLADIMLLTFEFTSNAAASSEK